MDCHYDYIILGTGMKECVISGLLSVMGYKVLHMDKNPYYGGASASLSLDELFEKFEPGNKPDPQIFGRSRDWCVDLIPKFIMADGELTSFLSSTAVSKYIDFNIIEGSYVVRDNEVTKVPSNENEFLKTKLLQLMEKKRFYDFLKWVQGFKPSDQSTWKYGDPKTVTMGTVFQKSGLNRSSVDMIGHAIALCYDESYLDQPFGEIMDKINLYYRSLSRYGSKSPYLYPLYGLGEIPQGFARLSAVYGGTYMLNKPVDEVVIENGVFVGVRSEGDLVHGSAVIADPSYFPDRSKKVGQVVRAICLLNHPIPATDNAGSCQIIIPQNQVNRKSDIYISCVSSSINVAPKGWYVALVSSAVETNDPESELNKGLALLGPIQKKFTYVSDIYEPIDDGQKSKIFISSSFDAASHFETACDDIKSLYQRILGKPLDVQEVVKRCPTNTDADTA